MIKIRKGSSKELAPGEVFIGKNSLLSNPFNDENAHEYEKYLRKRTKICLETKDLMNTMWRYSRTMSGTLTLVEDDKSQHGEVIKRMLEV